MFQFSSVIGVLALLAASLATPGAHAASYVQVLGYHASYNVKVDDVPQGKARGPFGSGGEDCAIQADVVTPWQVGSTLEIERSFQLSAAASGLEVQVAIDNDVQVWVNGVDVSGGMQMTEGCAFKWQKTFTVPDGNLLVGKNRIRVVGVDRGGLSFLGLRVRAVAR